MIATIVSGLGNTRTSTAVRFLRALRRLRPLGAGGHGSALIRSSSTARRMHECATFRYRPAVDGANGWPREPQRQPSLDVGEDLPVQLPQRQDPPTQPPVGLIGGVRRPI